VILPFVYDNIYNESLRLVRKEITQ